MPETGKYFGGDHLWGNRNTCKWPCHGKREPRLWPWSLQPVEGRYLYRSCRREVTENISVFNRRFFTAHNFCLSAADLRRAISLRPILDLLPSLCRYFNGRGGAGGSFPLNFLILSMISIDPKGDLSFLGWFCEPVLLILKL